MFYQMLDGHTMWRRRAIVVGVIVAIAIAVLGAFAPVLAPHNPVLAMPDNRNLPPAWNDSILVSVRDANDPLAFPDNMNKSVQEAAKQFGVIIPVDQLRNREVIEQAFLEQKNLVAKLQIPTRDYFLGGDNVGRDVLSRIIHSLRVDLILALMGIALSTVGAWLLILLRGRGNTAETNILPPLLSVPFIGMAGIILVNGFLLLLPVVIIAGQSFLLFLPWVGVFSAIMPMVLVYESARRDPTPSNRLRLALRHSIKLSPVSFSLALLMALLIESLTSFYGVGVPPPTPSLGGMINDGRSYLIDAWWTVVFPGVPLFLAAVALLAIALPITRIQERKIVTTNYRYADFWRRLGAAIIDVILVSIAALIVGMILGLTQRLLIGLIGEQSAFIVQLVENSVIIISVIGNWLYYATMESSHWQGTLGKTVLGIRVTDLQGNRISFARSTGRNLSKNLLIFTLFIGFLMIAFTARKQGLHDKMTDCLVVRSR